MRWRMYIFFLSATAAFCFMLLTAVTEHGSGRSSLIPLISASRDVSSGRGSASPLLASRSAVGIRDRTVEPLPARFYVPVDSDPIAAREDRARLDQANRGQPSHRHRLKWDEGGWYREEVALVTAYCPCPKCCGTQSPGITSTGKSAWTAGLAADPIYLEYGTKVFIPEYGLSVVDDTGGAMRRHWRRNGLLHIDVRMTYHYEARQWGSRYLRVKIYDE